MSETRSEGSTRFVTMTMVSLYRWTLQLYIPVYFKLLLKKIFDRENYHYSIENQKLKMVQGKITAMTLTHTNAQIKKDQTKDLF